MRMLTLILIALLFSGCASVTYKEVDPKTGTVTKEYSRTGFISWSDGVGKNLPFSHINVNGVGVDVPNIGK